MLGLHTRSLYSPIGGFGLLVSTLPGTLGSGATALRIGTATTSTTPFLYFLQELSEARIRVIDIATINGGEYSERV